MEQLITMRKYGFDRYSSIRMAYGPSFSPDGKTVSFVSDITGVPQVWALRLETGRVDQLTVFEHRVLGAFYAPNRSFLSFSMDPGGSENHQIWTLDIETLETRKLTSRDDRIHNFGSFSPDGTSVCFASNERDEKFFDVYAQRLSDPHKKLVHQSDATNYAVEWLNYDRIIVGRANTNLDSSLFVARIGEADLVHITPHTGEAEFMYAGFSEEANKLFVVSNVDSEFSQPVTIDLGSKRVDVLVEENWDAVGARLSRDGRWLAYFRNVDGVSKLHIYDVEKKHDRIIAGLPVGAFEAAWAAGYGLMDWSPDSRVLIFTFQGPRHNLNLWSLDVRDGSLRQLTFVPRAGIPQESFVEPVVERFPSFDGLQIPVLVHRPVGGQGALPTIVFVHGGPESQETARFNIAIQYFANHGFLVLAPNVRGSSGYGKHWLHLDDVEKRLDSVRDLEFLVKWAVGKGLARKGSVGVYGGSYGGFMVLSALTEFPELWGAGVDLVGIANFETFLERTAKWRRHLREAEYGSLERDRELFKRISPIHHVDRIQAPLLVIHGANDPRVPVGEAEQIVERLKGLGRQVEYLRFEDEGHGIAKIPNRVRAYTVMADFLQRTLLRSEQGLSNSPGLS